MTDNYNDFDEDEYESNEEIGGYILWERDVGTLFIDLQDAEEAYDTLAEGLSVRQAKKKKIFIDILPRQEVSDIWWDRATSPVQ